MYISRGKLMPGKVGANSVENAFRLLPLRRLNSDQTCGKVLYCAAGAGLDEGFDAAKNKSSF